MTITSRQNPLVARFYRAAARGDDDRLLLDGAHLVREAIAAGLRIEDAVVRSDAVDRHEIHDLIDQLRRRRIDVTIASPAVMDGLSPVRSPSAIVATARRPGRDAHDVYAGPGLVVIASDVQDPGNLGAIVRVAEAGGAAGVVAAGACADPFGWKALRGSMGSALRLPILRAPAGRDAVDEARRHGRRILATSAHGGTALFDVRFSQPSAVVIGNEGAGLPAPLADAADERVTIPMQAPVESLNAAVAAALIVFEAKRQHRDQPRRHENTKR